MRNTLLILIIALAMTMAFAKDIVIKDPVSVQAEKQSMKHRHSIGSSVFLLGNLPDIGAKRPVNFGQLNYGYQLTPKGRILVEAITWTYYEPLGTYGNSDEFYPGKVRAIGVGVGYQQLIWNNVYASEIVTPFYQQYLDSDNKEIQSGVQLYLTTILGYHFEFCKNSKFIEPALALKYWPVETNIPDAFQDINDGTPKYIFEPSLNFGFKF